MSQELINHSPDLKKLRDEGYEIEVRDAFLLVSGVPYLDSTGNVRCGTLVCPLNLAGDRTGRPEDHTIKFIGEQPCGRDGREIESIKHDVGDRQLHETITINRSFSNKPPSGYANYYDKVTRYIEIIMAPARSIDPGITAQTYNVIESLESESVFKYHDTNSSRAEIDVVTSKLKGEMIAIIGLGGTGGYVLDLVAKTPAAEIHLYDGDDFFQHNAFRAPGAPSIDELRKKPLKVEHFAKIYSRMRRNIFVHPSFIDSDNIPSFAGFTCVFICIDDGPIKKALIESLESNGITYIDVGMGVEIVDDKLIATARVTSGTPTLPTPIAERGRISFREADDNNDYDSNIQIAELNALNAALAVIKWKKLAGFYCDVVGEHNTLYTLNDNLLLNDDI